MILSVDTETYGIAKASWDGKPLPKQTVFNPRRSLETDGAALSDLVLTCSITEVKGDRDQPWAWEHGPTRVFLFNRSRHRRWCTEWLKKMTTMVGMNLPFDVQYLAVLPGFNFLLNRRVHLVDLAVINYLSSEMRPERSLKDIGPLFGLYRYSEEEEKREQSYENPHDPKLHYYNACDTHNTVTAIRYLSQQIRRDFPDTDKLSPWCLRHYSSVLWTCIEMAWNGVPLHRPTLEETERLCLAEIDASIKEALGHGLILEGKGSATIGDPGSRYSFMDRLCDAVDEAHPNADTVRSSRRLVRTKAKRLIAAKDENRHFLAGLLPPSHSLLGAVKAFNSYALNSKLVGSYLKPILREGANRKNKHASKLLSTGFVHPTWYPVPTQSKDSSSDSGGTEQGRITAKGPAIQTFPKAIKTAIVPPRGWSILWSDLSQIELRVAAILSGEPVLLRNYREGRDLHADRMLEIFGLAYLQSLVGAPLTAEEILKLSKQDDGPLHLYRQGGKTVNFADLFRSMPPTMRAAILRDLNLDLPIELFETIAAQRPVTRPVLWEWQERLIHEAKTKHRLVLPLTGQSRYFQGHEEVVNETYINTIVNFPIQTTAGNIMLQLQSELATLLPSPSSIDPFAKQIANIYDAVAVLHRTDRSEEVVGAFTEAVRRTTEGDGYFARICNLTGHSVPFKFDTKIVHGDPS